MSGRGLHLDDGSVRQHQRLRRQERRGGLQPRGHGPHLPAVHRAAPHPRHQHLRGQGRPRPLPDHGHQVRKQWHFFLFVH